MIYLKKIYIYIEREREEDTQRAVAAANRLARFVHLF